MNYIHRLIGFQRREARPSPPKPRALPRILDTSLINQLPGELLLEILQNLGLADQLAARDVCVLWRDLITTTSSVRRTRYSVQYRQPGIHALLGADSGHNWLLCTFNGGNMVSYTRKYIYEAPFGIMDWNPDPEQHGKIAADYNVTNSPFLDELLYSPFYRWPDDPTTRKVRYDYWEEHLVLAGQVVCQKGAPGYVFNFLADRTYKKDEMTVRVFVDAVSKDAVARLTRPGIANPKGEFKIIMRVIDGYGANRVECHTHAPPYYGR